MVHLTTWLQMEVNHDGLNAIGLPGEARTGKDGAESSRNPKQPTGRKRWKNISWAGVKTCRCGEINSIRGPLNLFRNPAEGDGYHFL